MGQPPRRSRWRRPLWRRGGGLVALLALLAVSVETRAVEFVDVKAEGIGRVLLMQDCEDEPGKAPCTKAKRQISPGDAERLDGLLRRERFDEIWLNSGGGSSPEGALIGHVLRRHGMAVRVRGGHRCASACTVAFLGGMIRTIDPEAQYLVHSRSAFLNDVDADKAQAILADPAGQLERFVLDQRRENRAFVAERLQYLQTMINGRPDAAAYASVMRQGLDQRPPYLSSPDYQRDIARIRVEKADAVQAVLLDLERQSFDEALALAGRHLDILGARAKAAHRMMDAMFATQIMRTSLLSQETLLQLGFVTPTAGR